MLFGVAVMSRESLVKILIILPMFLIGFAIGSLIKLSHEAASFKPYMWDNNEPKPIVMNCYDGKLDESKVLLAIDYWKDKGHEVMFYEHNPPPLTCDIAWIDGVIILRKAQPGDLDYVTLAITKRKTSLGKIHGVQILLKSGTQDYDLLLEHELGHAFGYGHYDMKGHIMHSLYEQMGPMFW